MRWKEWWKKRNKMVIYFISNSSNKWSLNSSSNPVCLVPGEGLPMESGLAICRSESSTTAGKNIGREIGRVVPIWAEAFVRIIPLLLVSWSVECFTGPVEFVGHPPLAVSLRHILFRLAPLEYFLGLIQKNKKRTNGDRLLECCWANGLFCRP